MRPWAGEARAADNEPTRHFPAPLHVDTEDTRLGLGAHSDRECILEEALFRFVRFKRDLVLTLAAKKA